MRTLCADDVRETDKRDAAGTVLFDVGNGTTEGGQVRVCRPRETAARKSLYQGLSNNNNNNNNSSTLSVALLCSFSTKAD